MRISSIFSAGTASIALFVFAAPASALTMQECSAKYKAAQKSGAAGDMNWNQFRSAECAAGATMDLVKPQAATKPAKEPKKAAEKRAPAKGKDAKAAAKDAGKDVLKSAKSAETKAPKSVKADATGPSMAECSARYRAAKQDGTLGNTTWNTFRAEGCVAGVNAAPAQKQAVRSPATRDTETTKPKAKAASTGPGNIKVSEQECSARYQAAKAADALGGMTWNSFRSAGCPATVTGRAGSMVPTAAGIFPSSIPRKYAHLPAGRARMLTCRDQYVANKAAGMDESKWSLAGGGFYSECNRRLSEH
ncbi:hypothetical protein [Hyphomicrobium sulfonivorans]|uniref:hypothetical protein n=1 Tax=Hyphomicrobium sulfonivorans TaxID=121290 RepID=UPI00156EB418|nr:hypothetical protein [Hyphomicrobium sulfonivorans]MBI1650930.1 hypothetical protein [Hyphomicrobium sulfonivorans]NSL72687.1 hypothetical protein [Hyphomicrobium sulfonivorans]